MIVTLTPNPSLDRTVEVPALVRGAVLRARGGRVDPGGKGVNVSRALAAHGRATRAVVPVGGAEGAQLAALLAPLGIEVHAVPVTGAVRANVAVVEPDGTTTKLNELGPCLSGDEVEALLAAAVASADGASWLAACGSLPPGAPVDLYARLAEAAHSAATRLVVDSSGPALLAALEAGPDLVKPNREELAEAVGRPLGTLGDVVEAAAELVARGAGAVLASLGADGAVLVGPDGATYGESRVDRPVSTVGAGDAMLAGFLAAEAGAPAATALASALAWGAAATCLPGSRMPAPHDLRPDAVRLHERIDPARPLEEQPR
ncbi:1-phosphofructokinase [Vallicoccus soli]|uniref:1-phosphofructokinase n=1 Tax=Vallicoccus soli TaxID=2339232 RepID=A0A3A3YXA5_9ACTN|nr:1-phosphofructokinase [Vallicoccus soli]RJK96278.1 1-phosphofructokinase [Vallicoccus soli]